MGEQEFRFWYSIRVRYRDVDRQDIVNFAVYLDYFGIGIHEYFRALDIHLRETEITGEFDSVFARVEVDYLGSARLDDEVRVGVRVARLGTSSLTFAVEARHGETGAVLARGRMVLVNSDRAAGRSKPLPQRVRDAVAAFEGLTE